MKSLSIEHTVYPYDKEIATMEINNYHNKDLKTAVSSWNNYHTKILSRDMFELYGKYDFKTKDSLVWKNIDPFMVKASGLKNINQHYIKGSKYNIMQIKDVPLNKQTVYNKVPRYNHIKLGLLMKLSKEDRINLKQIKKKKWTGLLLIENPTQIKKIIDDYSGKDKSTLVIASGSCFHDSAFQLYHINKWINSSPKNRLSIEKVFDNYSKAYPIMLADYRIYVGLNEEMGFDNNLRNIEGGTNGLFVKN